MIQQTLLQLTNLQKQQEESKSKFAKCKTRVQQWAESLLDKYEILRVEPKNKNIILLESLNTQFKKEEFKDESFDKKYQELKQKYFPQRGFGFIDEEIKKIFFKQSSGSDANQKQIQENLTFDVEDLQIETAKLLVEIYLKEINQRKGLLVPQRVINGLENSMVELQKQIYQNQRTEKNLYKKILIVVNSNKRQEQVINKFEQFFDERKDEFGELLELEDTIQFVISPYSLQDFKSFHFIEEKEFEQLFKVFKQINQKKAAKQGLLDQTSWQFNVEQNDVFVLLSRKIQDRFIHGELKITEFDIIAFDEIHIVFPEHPYTSIMTSFYYNCIDQPEKKLPYIFAFFNISIFSNESQLSEAKIIDKFMMFSNIFNSRLLTFNEDQINAIMDGYLSELRKVFYFECTPFLAQETFQYVEYLEKLLQKYLSTSSLQIQPHPKIFQLKKLKPFQFIHNAITGSKCTTAEAKQILENFCNKILEIRKTLQIDTIINNKIEANKKVPQISSSQIKNIYKIPLQTIQYVKEKSRYFTSRFEIQEDLKPLFDQHLEFIKSFDPKQPIELFKSKLESENWMMLQVLKCLQDSKYIGNDLKADEDLIKQRFHQFYQIYEPMVQFDQPQQFSQVKEEVKIDPPVKNQIKLKDEQTQNKDTKQKTDQSKIPTNNNENKEDETDNKDRFSEPCKEEEKQPQWFLRVKSFIDKEVEPILKIKSEFEQMSQMQKSKDNFCLNFCSSKQLQNKTDSKKNLYEKYKEISKEALGLDESQFEKFLSIKMSIKEDIDAKNNLLSILVFVLMKKPSKDLKPTALTDIKKEIARLAFNGDTAINLCVVQYLYFFKDSTCNEKELDKQKIEKVRASSLRIKSQSYKLAEEYMISIDSNIPGPGLEREPVELLQTICGYLSLYFGLDACLLFLVNAKVLNFELEPENASNILYLFSQKHNSKFEEFKKKDEIFKYITEEQGTKAMKKVQNFKFEYIQEIFKAAAEQNKEDSEYYTLINKRIDLQTSKNIYLEAFTHKSFSERISNLKTEVISKNEALSHFNYQRLEYLGDSLLNYTLSHLFYYESMEKEIDLYFPASGQHQMKTWFSSNHLNSFLLINLHFNCNINKDEKGGKLTLKNKNHIELSQLQRVPLVYDDQNGQYEYQIVKYQQKVLKRLVKYDYWERSEQTSTTSAEPNKLGNKILKKELQEQLKMASLQEEFIKYFSDCFEAMIGAIYVVTGDLAYTQKCIINMKSSALLDHYPIKENDRTRVLVNWSSKVYSQVLKLTHTVEENEKGTYIRGFIQSMEVIRIKFAKFQKNKVSKFYQDYGRYLDQAYFQFEGEYERKKDISSLLIKTKDGRIITQWQLTETHWIEFNRFYRKTYNSKLSVKNKGILRNWALLMIDDAKIYNQELQIKQEEGTEDTAIGNQEMSQEQLLYSRKLELLVGMMNQPKYQKIDFFAEIEFERVEDISIREIFTQANSKSVVNISEEYNKYNLLETTDVKDSPPVYFFKVMHNLSKNILDKGLITLTAKEIQSKSTTKMIENKRGDEYQGPHYGVMNRGIS